MARAPRDRWQNCQEGSVALTPRARSHQHRTSPPPPLAGAQCGSGPTRSLALLPGTQCRPNPTRSQPSAPGPPPSTLRASAALPAGRLPDLTPSPLEGVRCGSDLTRSLALMPGTQCGPNLTLSLPPAPTGVQCDSGLTQSLALVPGSQCDPNLTLSQPLLPPLWLPSLAPHLLAALQC